jgi:hypothetical protein
MIRLTAPANDGDGKIPLSVCENIQAISSFWKPDWLVIVNLILLFFLCIYISGNRDGRFAINMHLRVHTVRTGQPFTLLAIGRKKLSSEESASFTLNTSVSNLEKTDECCVTSIARSYLFLGISGDQSSKHHKMCHKNLTLL